MYIPWPSLKGIVEPYPSASLLSPGSAYGLCDNTRLRADRKTMRSCAHTHTHTHIKRLPPSQLYHFFLLAAGSSIGPADNWICPAKMITAVFCACRSCMRSNTKQPAPALPLPKINAFTPIRMPSGRASLLGFRASAAPSPSLLSATGSHISCWRAAQWSRAQK